MLKKCPKCGLPVPGLDVCPNCGTNLNESYCDSRGETRFYEDLHSDEQTIKREIRRFGKYNLTIMEILLLIITNISIVLVATNLIIGAPCWSYYAVVAMFAAYFITYIAMSRNMPCCLTRLRNSVLIFNIVTVICSIIWFFINHGGKPSVTFNYITPIILIAAETLVLFSLFAKDVSVLRALYTQLAFVPQSLILFICMLVGVIGVGQVSHALIIIAFIMNILTVINLAVIYALKCRNGVREVFKFWE